LRDLRDLTLPPEGGRPPSGTTTVPPDIWCTNSIFARAPPVGHYHHRLLPSAPSAPATPPSGIGRRLPGQSMMLATGSSPLAVMLPFMLRTLPMLLCFRARPRINEPRCRHQVEIAQRLSVSVIDAKRALHFGEASSFVIPPPAASPRTARLPVRLQRRRPVSLRRRPNSRPRRDASPKRQDDPPREKEEPAAADVPKTKLWRRSA